MSLKENKTLQLQFGGLMSQIIVRVILQFRQVVLHNITQRGNGLTEQIKIIELGGWDYYKL